MVSCHRRVSISRLHRGDAARASGVWRGVGIDLRRRRGLARYRMHDTRRHRRTADVRARDPMWRARMAGGRGRGGLMVCNPCYLFLSFSFMSEVPFLAALLACHLAFAKADGENEIRWLWLSAILGVVAFTVRPFGGAAILGGAGAILLYDAMLPPSLQASRAKMVSRLAPFAIAFVACVVIWIWLTMIRPPSWTLTARESHLGYLLYVSFIEYMRSGLLGPILYLGIVLSTMPLLRVAQ